MKYWGILLAKLVVAAGLLYAIWYGIHAWYAAPARFYHNGQELFLHDLTWTSLMFLYNLLVNGALWLIFWDQKRRCRTCGRRLRMPVSTGSHAHVLLGPPRTDYICPYGHGTLKVPELNLTGREKSDWTAHEDIWTELYSMTPNDQKSRD